MIIDTKQLQVGENVVFIGYGHSDIAYRRQLLVMGLTPGITVNITRIAPLGCPVQIEIRGTALLLRYDEAQYLQWER